MESRPSETRLSRRVANDDSSSNDEGASRNGTGYTRSQRGSEEQENGWSGQEPSKSRFMGQHQLRSSSYSLFELGKENRAKNGHTRPHSLGADQLLSTVSSPSVPATNGPFGPALHSSGHQHPSNNNNLAAVVSPPASAGSYSAAPQRATKVVYLPANQHGVRTKVNVIPPSRFALHKTSSDSVRPKSPSISISTTSSGSAGGLAVRGMNEDGKQLSPLAGPSVSSSQIDSSHRAFSGPTPQMATAHPPVMVRKVSEPALSPLSGSVSPTPIAAQFALPYGYSFPARPAVQERSFTQPPLAPYAVKHQQNGSVGSIISTGSAKHNYFANSDATRTVTTSSYTTPSPRSLTPTLASQHTSYVSNGQQYQPREYHYGQAGSGLGDGDFARDRSMSVPRTVSESSASTSFDEERRSSSTYPYALSLNTNIAQHQPDLLSSTSTIKQSGQYSQSDDVGTRYHSSSSIVSPVAPQLDVNVDFGKFSLDFGSTLGLGDDILGSSVVASESDDGKGMDSGFGRELGHSQATSEDSHSPLSSASHHTLGRQTSQPALSSSKQSTLLPHSFSASSLPSDPMATKPKLAKAGSSPSLSTLSALQVEERPDSVLRGEHGTAKAVAADARHDLRLGLGLPNHFNARPISTSQYATHEKTAAEGIQLQPAPHSRKFSGAGLDLPVQRQRSNTVNGQLESGSMDDENDRTPKASPGASDGVLSYLFAGDIRPTGAADRKTGAATASSIDSPASISSSAFDSRPGSSSLGHQATFVSPNTSSFSRDFRDPSLRASINKSLPAIPPKDNELSARDSTASKLSHRKDNRGSSLSAFSLFEENDSSLSHETSQEAKRKSTASDISTASSTEIQPMHQLLPRGPAVGQGQRVRQTTLEDSFPVSNQAGTSSSSSRIASTDHTMVHAPGTRGHHGSTSSTQMPASTAARMELADTGSQTHTGEQANEKRVLAQQHKKAGSSKYSAAYVQAFQEGKLMKEDPGTTKVLTSVSDKLSKWAATAHPSRLGPPSPVPSPAPSPPHAPASSYNRNAFEDRGRERQISGGSMQSTDSVRSNEENVAIQATAKVVIKSASVARLQSADLKAGLAGSHVPVNASPDLQAGKVQSTGSVLSAVASSSKAAISGNLQVDRPPRSRPVSATSTTKKQQAGALGLNSLSLTVRPPKSGSRRTSEVPSSASSSRHTDAEALVKREAEAEAARKRKAEVLAAQRLVEEEKKRAKEAEEGWQEMENSLSFYRAALIEGKQDRAALVLTGLIPKLRQCDMAASLSSKPDDQRLRNEQTEVLFGWINVLFEDLQGAPVNRGSCLDGIALIVESRLLKHFAFTSDPSLAKRYERILAELLYFAVDRLNGKAIFANTLGFAGKMLAAAFWHLPGVALKLLRLLPAVKKSHMQRILTETGVEPSPGRFPEHLRELCYSGTNLAAYARLFPPVRPTNVENDTYLYTGVFDKTDNDEDEDESTDATKTISVEMAGNWLIRWTATDSDLPFAFMRAYHRQLANYLPAFREKDEPVRAAQLVQAPGYLFISATLLEVCDALIHRNLRSVTTMAPSNTGVNANESANVAGGQKPKALEVVSKRVIQTIFEVVGGPLQPGTVLSSPAAFASASLRHNFGCSLRVWIAAATKRTSMWDTRGIFALLDLIEGLIFNVCSPPFEEDLGDDEEEPPWHPSEVGLVLFDLKFILSFVSTILSKADNTTCLLRTISFLYTEFQTFTLRPTDREELCDRIILHPDIFNRLFLYYNVGVRGYFLRLICYRLARLGSADDEKPAFARDPRVISTLRLLEARLEKIRSRHDELDPLDDDWSDEDAEYFPRPNDKRSTISSVWAVHDKPWILGEADTSGASRSRKASSEVQMHDTGSSEDDRAFDEDDQNAPMEAIDEECTRVQSAASAESPTVPAPPPVVLTASSANSSSTTLGIAPPSKPKKGLTVAVGGAAKKVAGGWWSTLTSKKGGAGGKGAKGQQQAKMELITPYVLDEQEARRARQRSEDSGLEGEGGLQVRSKTSPPLSPLPDEVEDSPMRPDSPVVAPAEPFTEGVTSSSDAQSSTSASDFLKVDVAAAQASSPRLRKSSSRKSIRRAPSQAASHRSRRSSMYSFDLDVSTPASDAFDFPQSPASAVGPASPGAPNGFSAFGSIFDSLDSENSAPAIGRASFSPHHKRSKSAGSTRKPRPTSVASERGTGPSPRVSKRFSKRASLLPPATLDLLKEADVPDEPVPKIPEQYKTPTSGTTTGALNSGFFPASPVHRSNSGHGANSRSSHSGHASAAPLPFAAQQLQAIASSPEYELKYHPYAIRGLREYEDCLDEWELFVNRCKEEEGVDGREIDQCIPRLGVAWPSVWDE